MTETVAIGVALDALKTILRRVFPDERVAITSELAEATFAALPAEIQHSIVGDATNALASFAVIPPPRPINALYVRDYWIAHARHERPGVHAFTEALPMVRLRLPEKGRLDLETAFGTCYAGDRRLYNLDVLREHYQDELDFEIGSADLITPARCWGARFGAIATYAIREASSDKVRAYALEAGMATGEPMVLYLAPSLLLPIVRRTWYRPTPFSSDDHRYQGSAAFEHGDPTTLSVRVYAKGASRDALGPKLIEVFVRYERTNAGAPEVWPSILTLRAACRVAAISERIGKPIEGAEFLTPILAAHARSMSWEVKP